MWADPNGLSPNQTLTADIGLDEEAEKLFADMKQSERCRPDSWSYSAMLNIYRSGGKVDKAMQMFDEISERGLGKASKFNDLVRVFNISVERGVRPDDRLCGCLLSIISLCEENEDVNKILSRLQKANPKLVDFIKLLGEVISFETIKDEFRTMLENTTVEARRPFCD